MVQPYHTQTRLERMRNNASLTNNSSNISPNYDIMSAKTNKPKLSNDLEVSKIVQSRNAFDVYNHEDDVENREPGLEITLLNCENEDGAPLPAVVISSSESSEGIIFQHDTTAEESNEWKLDDGQVFPVMPSSTEEKVNPIRQEACSSRSRPMRSRERNTALSSKNHSSSRNRVPPRRNGNNNDRYSIENNSPPSQHRHNGIGQKHSVLVPGNINNRKYNRSSSSNSDSSCMDETKDIFHQNSRQERKSYHKARSRSRARSSSQRRSRSITPNNLSHKSSEIRPRSLHRPQRSSSTNPSSRGHRTGITSKRATSRTRPTSSAPGGREHSMMNRSRDQSTSKTICPTSDQTQTAWTHPDKSSCNNSHSLFGGLEKSLFEPPIKLPQPLHTRVLLTTSVYHNKATGIWITTINMNQRGSRVTQKNAGKYLKAFSFRTEREARESAYANAPPKMLPFKENPSCEMCDSKFSMFRRPSHCRNCGICICNNCSVNWTKANMPDTYNMKNENYVKVCRSCNTLSKQFKDALLSANYEHAQVLYNTGNINLRCPFMKAKGGEAMLPIHCAAEGGSLILLKWLVDVHFCPIKRIRTGNKNRSQSSDEMIATSKGRTLLDIAMAGQKVDILKYLVQDKKVSMLAISGTRDLQASLGALEAVLKAYPSLMKEKNETVDKSRDHSPQPEDDDRILIDDNNGDDEEKNLLQSIVAKQSAPQSLIQTNRRPSRNNGISQGLPTYCIPCSDDEETIGSSDKNSTQQDFDSDEESVATTVQDACIICYENSIDCVITPCGHQICCLRCSQHLKTCPVCNVDSTFIKIFKP